MEVFNYENAIQASFEIIGNADIILLQREIPESVNIRTAEIAKKNNVRNLF